MKVLHVIGGISHDSGGPSRSVQGLVVAQCGVGIDAWLWPLSGGEPWLEGVRTLPPMQDLQGIKNVLQNYDIVHIHGIWSLLLHKVASMCYRQNIPYVIAPRGMLEPWSLKQKWLKKWMARFLYQDRDLKKASALHATAESEAEQFRELGFKNYCIVSANGVNLPTQPVEVKTKGEDGQRRSLFVSRMHPKKGVMELVEAWARGRPTGWCCELVYTTNSDLEKEYESKVKVRVRDLGLEDQFVFTGPLDDERKWEAYARADLFVLPTYSENFGIVVAEALWAGVPVITTQGTPWSDLASHNCGWWINLPLGDGLAKWDALDDALKEAFNLDSQTPIPNSNSLKRMGENGHRLVEQKYTWKAVVGAMKHGYEHVLSSLEHASCSCGWNHGDSGSME